MKASLLIIITLCYFHVDAQLRIGIQGGYNSAHVSPSHSSSIIYTDQSSSKIYDYTTTSLRGFQAGVVTELRLAHALFLRTSLLINGKGTRIRRIGMNDTSARLLELHYIEVPISVVHKWSMGKRLSAFGGGGLYAARAFRGVEIGEGYSRSGPYYIENHVVFRSDNSTNSGHPTVINPNDYGFNFITGVERRGIQLVFSFEQGLQRLFPKRPIFKEKASTNRVLGFSVVYLFKANRR